MLCADSRRGSSGSLISDREKKKRGAMPRKSQEGEGERERERDERTRREREREREREGGEREREREREKLILCYICYNNVKCKVQLWLQQLKRVKLKLKRKGQERVTTLLTNKLSKNIVPFSSRSR